MRHGFVHVRGASSSPAPCPHSRRSVSAEPRPATDEEELAFSRYVATFHFSRTTSAELSRPTARALAMLGAADVALQLTPKPANAPAPAFGAKPGGPAKGATVGQQAGPAATVAATPPPCFTSRLRADAPAFVPQSVGKCPPSTMPSNYYDSPFEANRTVGPAPPMAPPLPLAAPPEATRAPPTPLWGKPAPVAAAPTPVRPAAAARPAQATPTPTRCRWGDLDDDIADMCDMPEEPAFNASPTGQGVACKAAPPASRSRIDWDAENDDDEPPYQGVSPEAPKLTHALLGQSPERKAPSEDQVEHASLASHDSSSTTAPPSADEAPPPPRSPARRPPGGLQERSQSGRKDTSSSSGSPVERGRPRRPQRGADERWAAAAQQQAYRGGPAQRKTPNGKGQMNMVWRPKEAAAAGGSAGRAGAGAAAP